MTYSSCVRTPRQLHDNCTFSSLETLKRAVLKGITTPKQVITH
jgi:hypothetical protein